MSNDQFPDRGPERPRVEPEIIPPGRDRAQRGGNGMWMRFEQRDGMHRVFIARPGLPTIILGLVIFSLIVALILLVLAGIVFLWIPILTAAILLALASGALRYRWRRLQAWMNGR